MPPLRSHRKSRTGCLVCKKRRVKCDESGNPCANCSFRGLDCAYAELPIQSSRARPTLTRSRTASPAPAPAPAPHLNLGHESASSYLPQLSQPHPHPSPASPSSSYRLNLELMHTFSTETYKSLFTGPFGRDEWQVFIPRRALEEGNEFLLDGLLSIAALHTAARLGSSTSTGTMARKDEDEYRARRQAPIQLYIDVAMDYQSRALEPFQRAIETISQENCDVVFAHSIITIINGIAFPRVLKLTTRSGAAGSETRSDSDPTTSTSMLETIFTLFELVQGTALINLLTLPWLKDKDPCLVYENFWAESRLAELDRDTEEALERLNELNVAENQLQSRDHINTTTYHLHHQLSQSSRHALISSAIARLCKCFQRYAAMQDPVSVLTWLATVDRGFVDCLRRRETLPLLVLMHWGALLAMLDGGVWWAEGSGRALVEDVMGILQMRSESVERDLRVRGGLDWVRGVLEI
ncbi:hypothetical protein ASPCAL14073 [Aspergillus calidoustus]|uniref:Zn(2)-C6 fungal-type domain-containing protein n=1 Tax=Aspergillus calidoustus TaxID=454130 RepID=A0A0U5GGL3_ASPCI|nr:hypothetical protein ASPCAL14073 [Aspergillus calidoustus]